MTPWRPFLSTLLATMLGVLGAIGLLIALMNPYGNLPRLLPVEHAIMDTNQRFQYPAIIRSRRFDSAVFGTSSARLLKPQRLYDAFGGRFANLALDDGRAWEQMQLARLFLKSTPAPRTLVFALDWVWCSPTADVDRITKRGWPQWIFDDDPWNDWLYALNGRSVEIAINQLIHRLGLKPVRIPMDGYEVFVLPEAQYDLSRARRHIWGDRPPAALPAAQVPAAAVGADVRAGWRFPALAWLEETMLLVPTGTRRIVAFMPGHVVTQPVPGTVEAERIATCKRQAAAIAERHAAHFVDFWIGSPITTRDDNYWDPRHYRVGIADRIVAGLAGAVRDPSTASSDYRTVAP